MMDGKTLSGTTLRAREREERQVKAMTERRFVANELLSSSTFVKWLGDVMTRNGYFDNRELTSYQQGVRNGIAREAERLFEAADDGDKKFAEVFMENISKYANTEDK